MVIERYMKGVLEGCKGQMAEATTAEIFTEIQLVAKEFEATVMVLGAEGHNTTKYFRYNDISLFERNAFSYLKLSFI